MSVFGKLPAAVHNAICGLVRETIASHQAATLCLVCSPWSSTSLIVSRIMSGIPPRTFFDSLSPLQPHMPRTLNPKLPYALGSLLPKFETLGPRLQAFNPRPEAPSHKDLKDVPRPLPFAM